MNSHREASTSNPEKSEIASTCVFTGTSAMVHFRGYTKGAEKLSQVENNHFTETVLTPAFSRARRR